MVKQFVAKGILAVAAGCLTQTSALAGGLERGGYNIDLLFAPGRLPAESAVTFVAPQRKVKNVRDLNPTNAPLGGGDLNLPPNAEDSTRNKGVSANDECE